MSAIETEKLSITGKEYDALQDIRGLEESAHYMVMLAKRDGKGGYILEGRESAFQALQSDLSDEIYHQLSSPARLRQIRKLYDRLAPDCDF